MQKCIVLNSGEVNLLGHYCRRRRPDNTQSGGTSAIGAPSTKAIEPGGNPLL
jgi:hypothetical protein